MLLAFLVAAPTVFAERKLIRNHTFGIFQSRSGNVFLHIRNDDCKATYRAVVNEIILGEGTVDVSVQEIAIPFGRADLILRCSGDEMYADLQ
jgi:hypothetical protein